MDNNVQNSIVKIRCNILTFHYAQNYGAVWQAYALLRYIQNMDINCKILNYVPEEAQKYYNTPYIATTSIKAFIYNFLSILHAPKLKNGCKKFLAFREKNFECTELVHTLWDLKRVSADVDVFIAGSDQIWNCETKIPYIYFLDFENDASVKASYAASVGTGTVAKEKEKEFFDELKKLDYISVREKITKDYIQQILDEKIYENIDPVFLLDKTQWQAIVEEYSIDGKYILVFSLGQSSKLIEAIKKLKTKTKLKVIEVCLAGAGTLGVDKRLYDIGPAEMLSIIQNAEYVVTNSFHVTALSVVFHKNFYSVPKNYSTRIENLLNKFHLESRCIKNPSLDPINEGPIEYGPIEEIILKEREFSHQYLQTVFNSIVYKQ